MLKIQYNSPVILTFSILTVGVYLVDTFLIPGLTRQFFVVRSSFNMHHPLDYLRIFSYVLGHSGLNHLFGNLTYILLLGPILEEKYGKLILLTMILLTAIFTGIINILFFNTGLLGASGIVFMLIILSSIVDFQRGAIPLTFILVACIFIGTEVVNMFRFDNISQTAHIIGGALGAFFGFLFSASARR